MRKVIQPRKEIHQDCSGALIHFENLSLNRSAEITTSHGEKTKGWIPLIISGMGDGVIKAVFLPKRIGSILVIFPVSCVSSDY